MPDPGDSPTPPRLLFTAFEPSGDALAARLIAQLKKDEPGISIAALGGPLMQQSGAELIETTTEHAAMLTSAIGHALEHRQRVKRLEQWLKVNPITALVPVDSPAANWAICKLVRKHQPQARIIHLCAPQIWAWAPWRIHKLRRLTNHLLCLLPFEVQWFAERGVPGTFVGHPVFAGPVREAGDEISLTLPDSAGMKLAMLPGSRSGEIYKNFPTMLQAWRELRTSRPTLQGVIAVRDEKARDQVRFLRGSARENEGLHLVAGHTEAALAWADVVLVKSGTSTLQVAARNKPMVAMYNTNWWTWNFVGRFLIKTRTFTLPNLISESLGIGRVITELVPHFGAVEPVVREVGRLLDDAEARQAQVAKLQGIAATFAGVDFATRASAKVREIISGF